MCFEPLPWTRFWKGLNVTESILYTVRLCRPVTNQVHECFLSFLFPPNSPWWSDPEKTGRRPHIAVVGAMTSKVPAVPLDSAVAVPNNCLAANPKRFGCSDPRETPCRRPRADGATPGALAVPVAQGSSHAYTGWARRQKSPTHSEDACNKIRLHLSVSDVIVFT